MESSRYLPNNDIAEQRMSALIANRRALGISLSDIVVLDHLILKSRFKPLVSVTTIQLAEKLVLHLSTVQNGIRKLRELNYIRKTEYKGKTYLIVDPLIVNYGSRKARAFKIKLWEEAIQSKRKRQIPAS
jgi:DNA-binding transcriptional regulator YhcF (GntR family)